MTKKSLDVYTFDVSGRLTSIADKNGNTTTLAYGNASFPTRVTTVTDPAGQALTFAYDGNGYLTSVTDFASPLRTVLYAYTAGRLTQVTDVLGQHITYSYDANGYLATITDQRRGHGTEEHLDAGPRDAAAQW